jgi:hypothetical protein
MDPFKDVRHIPLTNTWHVGDGPNGEVFVVLGTLGCMVLSLTEALRLRDALDRHVLRAAQEDTPLIIEPGVRALVTGTLT